jgi:aspartate carbamoyltransferase catalytic subunit
MVPPGIECMGAEVYYDTDKAVEGADVVMMLRLQLERLAAGLFPGVREYAGLFGLNRKRLERAAPHALVMHPGPMNRGVEISSDVADGGSVILDQVTNGVAVRMAVMFLLSGGTKAEA